MSAATARPAPTATTVRPQRCSAEPGDEHPRDRVDAYALGWVGVELRDGSFGRAVLASSLYEIVAGSSGAAVIGVDIPLGMLPDRWRAADTLAADQLGPRRGSIFRVPPRPVWMESDFAAANRICREL